MSVIDQNKQWHASVQRAGSGAIVNCTWRGKRSFTHRQDYDDAENIYTGAIDRYETHLEGAKRGFDNVPVCAAMGGVAYLLASAYGCPIIYQNDLTVTRPKYATHESIKDFAYVPNAWENGFYEKIFKAIEVFNERYPEIPLSVSDTQSPIDVITELMPVDTCILMMMDDPALAHTILSAITQSMIDINRQFEARIHNFAGFAPCYYLPYGIHVSDDNAAFLSPDFYAEFAVPYAEILSAEFGGIFLHICMKFEQNIKNLASIKGFIGYDAMPYYNDPVKIVEALGGGKVWNVYDYAHSRPKHETESPEAYYKRLIDINDSHNAMRFDIYNSNMDDALRLAHIVKEYAAQKGMAVRG